MSTGSSRRRDPTERDGAQADGGASDDATRAVGNNHRITARKHAFLLPSRSSSESEEAPSPYPAQSEEDSCAAKANAAAGSLYHTTFRLPKRKSSERKCGE